MKINKYFLDYINNKNKINYNLQFYLIIQYNFAKKKSYLYLYYK